MVSLLVPVSIAGTRAQSQYITSFSRIHSVGPNHCCFKKPCNKHCQIHIAWYFIAMISSILLLIALTGSASAANSPVGTSSAVQIDDYSFSVSTGCGLSIYSFGLPLDSDIRFDSDSDGCWSEKAGVIGEIYYTADPYDPENTWNTSYANCPSLYFAVGALLPSRL